MHLITLRTYTNPFEANLVKTRLEDEGIHCSLFDENAANLFPLNNQLLGEIRIEIYEKDLEIATKILKEVENETSVND